MINTIDVITELLTEIGPDLNAPGVLQYAEDQWAIVYDEQTMVDICYRDDRHCLTLTLELGNPPPEPQLDTYRCLMAYSALTDQTGGIRIALDSPDGTLVQLLDLFTEDLDRVTLERAVNDFIDTGRAWRKVVEQGIVLDSGAADLGKSELDVDRFSGHRGSA